MEQENKLSTKQLKDLGGKTADVFTTLELIRQSCNLLLTANNNELDSLEAVHWQTQRTLNIIIDKLGYSCDELDKVAFALLECDNEKELKGV